MTVAAHAERLLSQIANYESCVVAFSGGVDSAVVLQAAKLALGDQVIAVTGVGPALSTVEHNDARYLASSMGVEWIEAVTAEMQRPGYVANDADRCFHCKSELYTTLVKVARERRFAVVANGANADDQGDYRPGMQAAEEFSIRSPLAACGLRKSDVRALAAHWKLTVADKPASPCLASRLAYGVAVTHERLKRVEAAEAVLRSLGLREFRVRCHTDEMARIEAPVEALTQLVDSETRQLIVEKFTQMGFKYVTLDLIGFCSGSLNAVLPVESLGRWSTTESHQEP